MALAGISLSWVSQGGILLLRVRPGVSQIIDIKMSRQEKKKKKLEKNGVSEILKRKFFIEKKARWLVS